MPADDRLDAAIAALDVDVATAAALRDAALFRGERRHVQQARSISSPARCRSTSCTCPLVSGRLDGAALSDSPATCAAVARCSGGSMKTATLRTATLQSVLDDASVVVCCGSGGVGKTTVAAAVGVEAARRGRRVVVVTIDPAKRLADALGVDELGPEPQPDRSRRRRQRTAVSCGR